MNSNNSGIGFAIDSNVFIDVVSPQNVVVQSVTKHNKATRNMVAGILRFLRGEFNVSNSQPYMDKVAYAKECKKYIPCYINIGTGGIEVRDGKPVYNVSDRKIPPVEEWWNTHKVKFSDTNLKKEVESTRTGTRYAISVLTANDSSDYPTVAGDVEQFVLHTEVSPNFYNGIYGGGITDIFVTEVGLYASNVPGTPDLLAGVALHDTDTDKQILYVRPQDTIIVRWVISIIALDDWSKTEGDSEIADTEIENGTKIDGKVSFNGTIIDERNN